MFERETYRLTGVGIPDAGHLVARHRCHALAIQTHDS